MSFDSEIQASLSLKVNLVFKVYAPAPTGVVYFSKYQPQSGLTVDSDKVGVIDSFAVPATQIDLLSSKQNIGSASITAIDKDDVFSNFLGEPLSAMIGLKADMYVGLITADGMDFSEYILEKEQYIVKTLSMSGDRFKIGLRSQQDRMIKSVYNFRGNLTTLITDSATSAVIETGTDTWSGPTGRAKIGNEFVQYTGKTFAAPNTTVTGLSRGDETSTAEEHKADTECWFVEKVIANPIDMLLQLMISSPGNPSASVYDVLYDGIGIPEADIDIAKFTAVKAAFFPSDTFTLFFYDIENALKYIETELLQANNLRFTEVGGKTSIAVLDQSVPDASLPQINSDVILAKPAAKWKLSENRLFNSFVVEYFFNEGTGTYAKTKQFNNTTSQAIHGIRTRPNFKFKGITSDGVAQERGNRLLARFSTPQSEISVSQFLKTYNTPPGEKVNFSHPDLPAAGGGKGLSGELELLKRAINYATGTVKASYVFTSYINLRRGLIAPSDDVVTVIAPNQITVGSGRGALYEVGYVLNLYNKATCALIDGSNNTITAVTGDTITFANAFTGLAAGTTMIRFADYDDSNDAQRARYMYIVGGSGLFADGSGGYKIF